MLLTKLYDNDDEVILHEDVKSVRCAFLPPAILTCLLISAPVCSNHNKQSGWPPKAAMWVGVWANLEVTALTPQPTWTRRITHSS